MTDSRRQRGFSLTEVLMALGTMAIGMLFVGGTFVVAVHYSVRNTEQTHAAGILQEAQAKLALGWTRRDTSGTGDPETRLSVVRLLDPNGYAYPTDGKGLAGKQYFWAALEGPVTGSLRQVIVFACRRLGSQPFPDGQGRWQVWPEPIAVTVVSDGNDAVIEQDSNLIHVGTAIVADDSGRIYRVVDRRDDRLILDARQPWRETASSNQETTVWVIPPARGTTKNPDIAVVSRRMRL